jgi:hypothetical protein
VQKALVNGGHEAAVASEIRQYASRLQVIAQARELAK